MGNYSLWFAGMLLIAGLAACSPAETAATAGSRVAGTTTPTQRWEPAVLQLNAEGNLLDAAEFIDERNGYVLARVVGYSMGATMRTADGGKTWTYQDLTLPLCAQFCNPKGFDVVDKNLIWLSTDTSAVYVSTDAGKDWRLVTNPGSGAPLPYLSFLDARRGWVGDPSEVFSTDDGGTTWSKLNLPPGVGKVAAIDLAPASGYILDGAGRLHKTEDGGKSWSTRDLGLGKEVLVNVALPMAAMRFPDPLRGVIVLGLVDDEGRVWALRTSDGGIRWEKTELPVALGAFHFSNDGLVLSRVQSVDLSVVMLRGF